MKISIYLLFTFLSFQQARAESLFSDNKTNFELQIYKSIRIGGACSKSCEAQKAVDRALNNTKKLTQNVFVMPNGMNPSSALCKYLEGNPWFLYDQQKNAVSICSYKDKSFFLSWDLFNKTLKK